MDTLPPWSPAEARAYLAEHALNEQELAILEAIYDLLEPLCTEETASPFQIAAALVTDLIVMAMTPHLPDNAAALGKQHALAETHLHLLTWAKVLCAREERPC